MLCSTQYIALVFITLLAVAWSLESFDAHKELKEEYEQLKRALETPGESYMQHIFQKELDELKETFKKPLQDSLKSIKWDIQAPPPPPTPSDSMDNKEEASNTMRRD